MSATGQILTADDLWRMPDDRQRHELIRGELTMMAPAGGGHGRLAMRLGWRLGAFVEERRLGVVLAAETGFVIGRDPDTVRAPDAAFVSKARIPASGISAGFLPLAPDLAVEVLSPGDSQIDVEEKIQQWLDAGTAMVWVMNPRLRTITVHRPGRDPRVMRDNDVLSGEDVVPGFSVALADLFRQDI